MHNLDARRAKRILLAQFVAALVVAALALVAGAAAAGSALLGGVTAAAANALVAMRVFGRYEAQAPAKLVARFYGAELLKLLFVGLVFGGVFAWVEGLNVAALFGAFILVQVLPLLLVNRLAR
jgi:ATP synthase protein I